MIKIDSFNMINNHTILYYRGAWRYHWYSFIFIYVLNTHKFWPLCSILYEFYNFMPVKLSKNLTIVKLLHIIIWTENKLYSEINGNRSKAPDKKPHGQKPPGQKPPENKPLGLLKGLLRNMPLTQTIFRLGSTNPKQNSSPLFFLGFYTGGLLSGCFCPGNFCPGVFCREAFDLEPNKSSRIS